MIILGLDPAQKTGWAIYDTARSLSAIRCGTLKINAAKGEFEQNAAALGEALRKLLESEIGRPDLAVLERAPRKPYAKPRSQGAVRQVKFMGVEMPAQDGDEDGGVTGLQSVLSTGQMTGGLSAVLGCFSIPIGTMTTGQWHKAAYGFGTRKGWDRKSWKRHAREMCSHHRITATNDDMAEACWIAFAGTASDAFKQMLIDQQKKGRAA